MIKPKTRWDVGQWTPVQDERAAKLAAALKLPPLVARLLVARGVDEPEAARLFLEAGPEHMHDPYRLKGMEEAVERIRRTTADGGKIRIYGDYDADGVSATSLLIRLFRRLGYDFDYYIPDRLKEGYGLNRPAIDQAAAAGVRLLLTVDTGVSAVDEVAYARELGMEVVVTDHHEPPEVLPEAHALINPKQPGCPYPFKGLAGAGVAFKLAHALTGEPPLELADVAALGTIADLMPLTGENRILVRCGLAQMRGGSVPGLRALAEKANVNLAAVTAADVAFGMAPRVNASGRLSHADHAVTLLTTERSEEAEEKAALLDGLNRERQKIVDAIVREAEEMWEARCDRARREGETEPPVIVLAGEGWNVGVIGIVASKLLEKHYKPTVILSVDGETGLCKGSARSIDGYDLHAALTSCAELFEHFGGHQAAAGMTLHRDRLAELERRLGEWALRTLTDEDWIPKTRVDLVCALEEASVETIEQLDRLQPFGADNPSPRVLIANVNVADRRTMGKDGKHLKLSLAGGGRLLDAVGFGMGGYAEQLAQGAYVSVIGELAMNEWNGNRRPQLLMKDLRVEQVQLFDLRGEREPLAALRAVLERTAARERSAAVLAATQAWAEAAAGAAQPEQGAENGTLSFYTFESMPDEGICCEELVLLGEPASGERLAAVLERCNGLEAVHAIYRQERASPGRTRRFPGREQFAKVYQLLRRAERLPERGLSERLAAMAGLPADTVEMMLDVFAELAFIERREGSIYVNPSPQKRELSESARYRAAVREAESASILHAPYKELSGWIAERSARRTGTLNGGATISSPERMT
ncbi:single-stranded DNA exonuclease RecJ [Paenibacillus sp. 32O-W]|uniref:single-stranded-DNA-specific exonuclease RecJ n=1 Tax=Paenibacillus sp. 32O-W TaxID=1695218 RepID=UPI00072137A0|nr:single-stranded-DNA-specific exonuclease RecJ [Paenibacillus sp. 32O-W]ALS27029.1 single-stranded DNA exonuclease RecJ [Paenibacillus sp. 32O-W]